MCLKVHTRNLAPLWRGKSNTSVSRRSWVPPHVAVWRSARRHGESRRTIALPKQVVEVLEEHLRWQKQERASHGIERSPAGRVFTTRSGEPLDAANVRRDFRAIVVKAGLESEWTPRELRHSSVSLLSDHGIPLERIALLVGHSSRATAEAVYRKRLRPVITQGLRRWTRSSSSGPRTPTARLDQKPLAPGLAPQA
ncbi:tyrosine-type recombinase/integrase [Streptomyces sp. LN500]|uniref:tyrosine-type recombinase/integrase n=1 Tax=Streptomyces sp. LN500 TaxID=3112978 RepID=UPI00371CC491